MTDESAAEAMEVCRIDGDVNAPLTVGVFNRFIAQLRYYHKRPIEHKLTTMSEGLKAVDRKIDGHIDYHTALEHKIDGAKRALYFVAAAITILAPIVYKFLDIIWPMIEK